MFQLSHTNAARKTIVVGGHKAQQVGIVVAKVGAAGIADKHGYTTGIKYVGGVKYIHHDGSDGC